MMKLAYADHNLLIDCANRPEWRQGVIGAGALLPRLHLQHVYLQQKVFSEIGEFCSFSGSSLPPVWSPS